MAEGTGKTESLSIWFFVGLMTFLYGIVLFPYGLWEWAAHREAATVLHDVHATVWWGLLLLVFGSFYLIRYRPAKR